MKNFKEIKKEEYVRAFSFPNLGYLFVSAALTHYKLRGFLAINQDGMLDQYLNKKDVDKTLEIGLNLFSDDEKFKIFEKDFRECIKQAKKFVLEAKEKEDVTLVDFYDLKAVLSKIYRYFEKTEFFFTDKCYENNMSDLLKKNLLILGDDLKVEARPLMVELLTTIPYKYTAIVAKKNSLDPEDMKQYSLDEVMELLDSGTKVGNDVIKKRRESFVVYSDLNTILDVMDENKDRILNEFKRKDVENVSEFKGTIASKGKVTAKVRVIPAELDKDYDLFVKKILTMDFDDGDILVTETTSPDYMPLLRKAGGVIADQGGMNSHAAITSREFKIPCLVATHNAIEILKTGDVVELDANIGVVKIIKRK